MRIIVDVASVAAALEALQKSGVQTLGGGTIGRSDPIGVVMVSDADEKKAIAVLSRASISARLG
jgi:hypothetical protein